MRSCPLPAMSLHPERSITLHQRTALDARHRPVGGRSGRSRLALPMHKHKVQMPTCSAAVGIANGAERP